MILRKVVQFSLLAMFLFLPVNFCYAAQEENSINEVEKTILDIAIQCRMEIINEFEKLLSSNKLTFSQLFDTFYIPIKDTEPQKFSTQYDKITDQYIRIILDKYLNMNKRLIFVVLTDINGYVPTHNSKYSMPLTSDIEYNAKNNRTKRLFNDKTGISASKNKDPFLIQKYERDTGNYFYDLSVPIFIKDKHWGAVRIGFMQ